MRKLGKIGIVLAALSMAVVSFSGARASLKEANAADPVEGIVLWGETFGHFGTKTPSSAGTGTGTTIFDGASITYAQSSNNTKGYNENLAGGTAPELLLSKSNQTWTISGIKTGGALGMSLTFLSNKTAFSLTCSSGSYTIGGSQKSWTLSLKDGETAPQTINLTLTNTSKDNARIDNVELKATQVPSPTPSKTLSSIAVKTAPSKVKYKSGDKFQPNGLVITATYDDKTTEDIDYLNDENKFTFLPALTTPLQKTDTQVKITYGGKDTTQAITVEENHEVKITGTTHKLDVNSKTSLSASCAEGDLITWSVKGSTDEKTYLSIPDGSTGESVEVTAVRPGSGTIVATCFHGESSEYTINVSLPISKYELVTDASKLEPGDKLVIASTSKGKTAGDFSGTNVYLSPVSSTFSNNQITVLNEGTMIFTLGGSANEWTLSNSSGEKLGATGNKALAWNKGETTWKISIDSNNNATIESTDSTKGRFLYNATSGSERFVNYNSGTSTSTTMLLPQLYKGVPDYQIQYNANGGVGSLIDDNYYVSGETVRVKANNTITKDNCTFNGWNTQADGKGTPYAAGDTFTYSNKVTLYAQWLGEEYGIIYQDENGDEFDSNLFGDNTPLTYRYLEGKDLVDAKNKTGYTFTGWYNGNTKVTRIEETSTGSVTLVGKYTADVYSISYIYNGESFTNPVGKTKLISSHTYGTPTALSVDAFKTGYNFIGFYTDEGLQNKITQIGATDYTSNITLYIKFEVATYSITYYDGANPADPSLVTGLPTTFKYNVNQIIEAGGVKTGHEFKGWYTNAAMTSKLTTNDEGKQYIKAESRASDISLYGKWDAKKINITYKYDLGTGEGEKTYSKDDVIKSYTYGVGIDELTPANKLEGYSFVGFYDNAQCTGSKITSITGDYSAVDFTLYIKFELNEYTVVYMDGDSPVESSLLPDNMPTTHTYGTATTIYDAYDKKIGDNVSYEFDGWYYDSEFKVGVNNNTIPKTRTGDPSTHKLTIYGRWVGKTYNINYKLKDGGVWGSSYKHEINYPKEYTCGNVVTLDTPSKDDYDFNGYYLDAACETTPITQIDGTKVAGDITVYGKFVAHQYKITYYDEGEKVFTGEYGPDTPFTHTYGTATQLVPATKDGYTFDGWRRDAECLTNRVTSLGKESIHEDVKLYAKWIFKGATNFNNIESQMNLGFDYKENEDADSSNADGYTKITSNQSNWSGTYLLVYNGVIKSTQTSINKAWTGVDSAKCGEDVTIENNRIATKPTNAVTVTVAALGTSSSDGYSIQVNGGTNNGKYIGNPNASNTISFSSNTQKNMISYDTDSESVLIEATGGYILKFNWISDQLRFRYLKSTSPDAQPIQLYKLDESKPYSVDTFKMAVGAKGLKSYVDTFNDANNNAIIEYGIKLTNHDEKTVAKELYFSHTIDSDKTAELGYDVYKIFDASNNQVGVASWYNDNGIDYVIINLGEVLNSKNMERAFVEFTVQSYIKTRTDYYESSEEKSKTYSVWTMIDEYAEDERYCHQRILDLWMILSDYAPDSTNA